MKKAGSRFRDPASRPLGPLTTDSSDAVTRTRDPVINSHLLYQLSYVGTTGG